MVIISFCKRRCNNVTEKGAQSVRHKQRERPSLCVYPPNRTVVDVMGRMSALGRVHHWCSNLIVGFKGPPNRVGITLFLILAML